MTNTQPIKISKFLEFNKTKVGSYASCPSGDAARVIPPIIQIHCKDGSTKEYVLFVEEYREPVGKTIVNFPGGRLNKGEDSLKAIVRELFEETGIDAPVDKFSMLLPSLQKDPKNSDEKEALYMCDHVIQIDESHLDKDSLIKELISNQHLDKNEDCKIKLVDIHDLPEFSEAHDMDLPTRIATNMLIKNILGKSQHSFKPKYSIEGDELYPTLKAISDQIVAKEVFVNKPYSYYTPKDGSKTVAFLFTTRVNGMPCVLSYETVSPSSGDPVLAIPEVAIKQKADMNTAINLANKAIIRADLGGKVKSVQALTGFDAVSPGITDKRQCVVMIELQPMSFKEIQSLGATPIATDYLNETMVDSPIGYTTALASLYLQDEPIAMVKDKALYLNRDKDDYSQILTSQPENSNKQSVMPDNKSSKKKSSKEKNSDDNSMEM